MSLFTAYFRDIITVQQYVGVNGFGDAEYTEQTDVNCRIEYKTQETLDNKGNKVISTAAVYADKPITPLSIVIVSGERYTVKSCSPISSLSGEVDHYEIIL